MIVFMVLGIVMFVVIVFKLGGEFFLLGLMWELLEYVDREKLMCFEMLKIKFLIYMLVLFLVGMFFYIF